MEVQHFQKKISEKKIKIRCLPYHIELFSEGDDGLFSISDKLLQVLISELFTSTALPRALPASFYEKKKQRRKNTDEFPVSFIRKIMGFGTKGDSNSPNEHSF